MSASAARCPLSPQFPDGLRPRRLRHCALDFRTRLHGCPHSPAHPAGAVAPATTLRSDVRSGEMLVRRRMQQCVMPRRGFRNSPGAVARPASWQALLLFSRGGARPRVRAAEGSRGRAAIASMSPAREARDRVGDVGLVLVRPGSARYRTMRFPSPGVRGRGGRRRSPLCACRPQHAPACAFRSPPAAELAAHIACGEPGPRGRCVARHGGMRLRVVPAVYSANGAARIRIGKAAWVVSQRALPAGIAAASAAQQARR